MKRLFSLLLLSLASTVQAQPYWPHWRGPDMTGVSPEKGFPAEWNEKSVVWKTRIKGKGQSSPVVWGDRIFVTTAEENGNTRLVVCLDRKSGKIMWEEVAWKGTPEPSHAMNGWATPTCVTDGQHVYAFFGKAGAHCFTTEGKKVWSKELGEFLSKTKRGVAASPILAGDLLIINGDSESDPFLFGLHKKTGEIAWKVDRPKKEGYSTPILIDVNGKQEMILNGDPYVAGYNPATGEKLWSCKSFAPRGEPTPTYAHGLVITVNGIAADVYAVKPGGKGDVTKTHLVWHTPRRAGRDEPCPLVVGDYLFVSNMEGLMTCYEAKTGKELWKERVSNARITAAPTAVDGLAFFITEPGETIVLKPGPKMDIVARNTVGSSPDELFRSIPTPVQGQWLIRSDQVLYCVGK